MLFKKLFNHFYNRSVGQAGPNAKKLREWLETHEVTRDEHRIICVVDGVMTATGHLHYGMTREASTEFAADWLLTAPLIHVRDDGQITEPFIDFVRSSGEHRDVLMLTFITFLKDLGMPATHTRIDRASDMVVVAVRSIAHLKAEDAKSDEQSTKNPSRSDAERSARQEAKSDPSDQAANADPKGA